MYYYITRYEGVEKGTHLSGGSVDVSAFLFREFDDNPKPLLSSAADTGAPDRPAGAGPLTVHVYTPHLLHSLHGCGRYNLAMTSVRWSDVVKFFGVKYDEVFECAGRKAYFDYKV